MSKDLYKPLLGDAVDDVDNVESNNNSNNRQNDEDDADVRAVWFLCSLKVMGSVDADDVVDDDEDDDLEKNLIMDDDVNDDGDDTNIKNIESSTSRRWYWNCFISSILPLLLYFQFYITYHFNSEYDTEEFESSSSSMIMMTNDWPSIQWSIFLFIVTSILYRQSMAFQKDTNSDDKNSISYFELLLHLVPDIIIDILLILILFHYYMAAVLVMQISTIFLALNAILNSCNCSIYVGTTTTHERN